jgi:hypothetical protein
MGSMQASEFASLVAEGNLDLISALTWHHGSNHYPPVLHMMDAAQEAIEAANEGDWERMINLPAGLRWRGETEAPVAEIVSGFHLESFISQEDDSAPS